MPERSPVDFLVYPNPASPRGSAVSIEATRSGRFAYLGIDLSVIVDKPELYPYLKGLIEAHFPTLNYIAGTFPFGKRIATRLGRELQVPQVHLLDSGRNFRKPDGLNPESNRILILDPELDRGKQALRAAEALSTATEAFPIPFEVLGVAAVFDWHLPIRQSKYRKLGLKTKALVGAEELFEYLKSCRAYDEDLINKAITSRKRTIRQQAGERA